MAVFERGGGRMAFVRGVGLAIMMAVPSSACHAHDPVPAGSEVLIGDLPFRAQSLDRVDAISTEGQQRIRFEVRPGERREKDRARGNRSERAELAAKEKVFFGQTTTARFSLRIVSMEDAPGQQQTTLIQLHGPNRPELGDFQDMGPPPFAMRVKGDVIEMLARSGSEYDGAGPEERIAEIPIDIGEWQDFAIRITLGDDRNGAIHVWRGDELVADYWGPVGYDVGRGAHYWKFGIYQYGQRKQPSIVEFDAIDFDERGYLLRHDGQDTSAE